MIKKKLYKKITSNNLKHLLIEIVLEKRQDKIGKLRTYDSSLFLSQSFFNNGAQLCLILQTLYYILKILGDTEKVLHGNLKVCQSKTLLHLQLLITTFLHQLNGTEIQIFD